MKYSQLIEKYTKIEKIKEGGQKQVFKAVNHEGKVVALKIINGNDNKRVLEEIRILKSININNVPVILDTGFVNDEDNNEFLYIEEEFIEGTSLRDLLNTGNKLDTIKLINLLETLIGIETKLENEKIIHRDINPNNIMVTENGEFILIDFGLAKQDGNGSLTNTMAAHGPHTPGYAPMELYNNIKSMQDARTDLFEIGVTAYESYSGKNPFFRKDDLFAQQIQSRTLNEIQKTLEIEGDDTGILSNFINMLMAKNPSQRPDTAKNAYTYLQIIKQRINLE